MLGGEDCSLLIGGAFDVEGSEVWISFFGVEFEVEGSDDAGSFFGSGFEVECSEVGWSSQKADNFEEVSGCEEGGAATVGTTTSFSCVLPVEVIVCKLSIKTGGWEREGAICKIVVGIAKAAPHSEIALIISILAALIGQ